MISQKATAGPSGLVHLKKSSRSGIRECALCSGGCGTCSRHLFQPRESWDPDLATLSTRACSGRGLLVLQAVRVTRGRRLRCGSAERGTSGERACRGRPRRGGSAQRQEGGAAARGGRRPAAGRVERVRLHAPPAGLAGFLFLRGEHSFPAGVRERAGWRAHRLASTHARARDHPCCSPGRADRAAAVSLSPESRGKQNHCASERDRCQPAPLGIKPSRLLPLIG